MDSITNSSAKMADTTIPAAPSWQYPPIVPYPPIQYGWQCPVCKKVNAPWNSACTCHNSIVITGPVQFYPGSSVSIGASTEAFNPKSDITLNVTNDTNVI